MKPFLFTDNTFSHYLLYIWPTLLIIILFPIKFSKYLFFSQANTCARWLNRRTNFCTTSTTSSLWQRSKVTQCSSFLTWCSKFMERYSIITLKPCRLFPFHRSLPSKHEIFIDVLQGDFTVESEAAKKNFEDQAVEKMKSMLSVLPNMSTQYLKCDPIKHKQGETYLEVTKLLQVNFSPFSTFFKFKIIYATSFNIHFCLLIKYPWLRV